MRPRLRFATCRQNVLALSRGCRCSAAGMAESSTPPLLKPKRLCIASTRELVEGIHYLAKTPCSDEKGQSMFCAIGFASAHSTSISRAALLEAAAVDSSPLGTSSL